MSASKKLDVVVEPDCGNAPRKAQVRDLLIALTAGDSDTVCRELADDIRWDVVGERVHNGIDEARHHVEQLAMRNDTQLSIRHLLSHGKHVAAEGSTTTYRFAHIVTYTGHGKAAQVAEVISYLDPGP